jgi:hypothetical protein
METPENDMPGYTVPSVNPLEASSIAVKEHMRPKFEFASNPDVSEQRVHPDMTRNPSTKQWTKSPINRSK